MARQKTHHGWFGATVGSCQTEPLGNGRDSDTAMSRRFASVSSGLDQESSLSKTIGVFEHHRWGRRGGDKAG